MTQHSVGGRLTFILIRKLPTGPLDLLKKREASCYRPACELKVKPNQPPSWDVINEDELLTRLRK
jgi:hypothetical protein